MRPHSQDLHSSKPDELRDKALNLREAVNSSRARMSAQKERLERLRLDIAELRTLVAQPLPAPARTAPPAPAPVRSAPPLRSAPLVKEAAPVSAAATASFKVGARYDAWKPVPYIAIFFVAVGMQLHATRIKASVAVPAAPAVAAPAPLLDDGAADEALMLAHDWRLPGDERPLSERLGSDTNPPGTQPDWTAERTGERTYRVTFKPSGSEAGYDFDVDLTARRVDPTPETAELISPRLASRR
jgi:hypothetical protein